MARAIRCIPSIGVEDHREGQVCVQHQPGVLATARTAGAAVLSSNQQTVSTSRTESGVTACTGRPPAEADEPAGIPRVEARIRGPEVVLLPHDRHTAMRAARGSSSCPRRGGVLADPVSGSPCTRFISPSGSGFAKPQACAPTTERMTMPRYEPLASYPAESVR